MSTQWVVKVYIDGVPHYLARANNNTLTRDIELAVTYISAEKANQVYINNTRHTIFPYYVVKLKIAESDEIIKHETTRDATKDTGIYVQMGDLWVGKNQPKDFNDHEAYFTHYLESQFERAICYKNMAAAEKYVKLCHDKASKLIIDADFPDYETYKTMIMKGHNYHNSNNLHSSPLPLYIIREKYKELLDRRQKTISFLSSAKVVTKELS